ncbi:hypothetical protein TEQG_05398 [Trichophyton equinum CBS 127.97]|uniref:Uncharacterized protein n=1 Tax=Trichophyton equinum (strain ATCC MYA-4606 / CBS 127.97) TaxID=559882 RepID=F2PWX7_TRIEC|nr:hypothetical protein TEQG_05398 [Trichophyton equinum CBS 127.97]
MELSPQLPEPGTPVVVKLAGAKPSSQSLKHQSSAHISPPKEQWNGVVVQTPDFPSNFQVPVNAVCVRLKRSENGDAEERLVWDADEGTGSLMSWWPTPWSHNYLQQSLHEFYESEKLSLFERMLNWCSRYHADNAMTIECTLAFRHSSIPLSMREGLSMARLWGRKTRLRYLNIWCRLSRLLQERFQFHGLQTEDWVICAAAKLITTGAHKKSSRSGGHSCLDVL